MLGFWPDTCEPVDLGEASALTPFGSRTLDSIHPKPKVDRFSMLVQLEVFLKTSIGLIFTRLEVMGAMYIKQAVTIPSFVIDCRPIVRQKGINRTSYYAPKGRCNYNVP